MFVAAGDASVSRNRAFEAQPRLCANGKHTACLFGMPPRGSGVPGIGDLAFQAGFPGGENAKGKSLRDFAFESKISKRFCFINFVRCLRGCRSFQTNSPTFTGSHRFSIERFQTPAERFSPDFTGFHRTPRSPSPGGAKVNSGATCGLLLPSLAWVLSRACQQGECALGTSRLPKDACAAHKGGWWAAEDGEERAKKGADSEGVAPSVGRSALELDISGAVAEILAVLTANRKALRWECWQRVEPASRSVAQRDRAR